MNIYTKKHQINTLTYKNGFSLIEMIGVLAVIALLSAMLAPKILDTISGGRNVRLATEIAVYEVAIAKRYQDIGTLNRVNADCEVTDFDAYFSLNPYLLGNNISGCKNDKSPYLDKLTAQEVAVSTIIWSVHTISGQLTPSSNAFDLNGDGVSDTTDKRVVYIAYYTLEEEIFLAVDNIIDRNVSDQIVANNVGGKVKWTSSEGGLMKIYIAHK
ncbi:MAG: type II secretion system protein [Nitrospinota bacterium]